MASLAVIANLVRLLGGSNSDSMHWPSSDFIGLAEGLTVGGGRGVVAKVDLHPGQLILMESPLVLVPSDKGPQVRLSLTAAEVTHACVQLLAVGLSLSCGATPTAHVPLCRKLCTSHWSGHYCKAPGPSTSVQNFGRAIAYSWLAKPV